VLFTIEIDEDWFDALDSLIEMSIGNARADILAQDVATPEEAVEISILSQLKLQRIRMREGQPPPQKTLRLHKGDEQWDTQSR
jgi:hypothetical protein